MYNKIIKDIKIPFRMEGGDRIDDTPVHKAIREALANCLINADFYGTCGVVIRKEPVIAEHFNPDRTILELSFTEKIQKTNADTGNDSENVIENVIEIFKKQMQNRIPEYSKKKIARACEIVKMMAENPQISIDEMRKAMDVTDRTIARYISDLKGHGIIERVGPDNGGSWKILL